MVFDDEYDWKKYPELRREDLEEFGLLSPHEQITGDFVGEVVKVHDGDTVRMRVSFRDFDFPVRLLSIDAPELSTGSDGMMVRDYLAGRVEGRQVEVRIDRFNRVDKWGRLLGDIVADGINLSEEMLSLGLVTPFERRREGEIVSVDKILDVKQWF